MFKKCKVCSMWANKNNSLGYQEWLANRVCKANHSGSSGLMELTRIANVFKCSITKKNLRHTNYVGDVDSSAFNTIKESKPYSDNYKT